MHLSQYLIICFNVLKKNQITFFDISEGEYLVNIMMVDYTISIFRGSSLIAAFQISNIWTPLDKQICGKIECLYNEMSFIIVRDDIRQNAKYRNLYSETNIHLQKNQCAK